jgi:hypothetical protein
MMNMDQARAGDGPAPKKKPENFETQENKLNIEVPAGWKSLKTKKRGENAAS